MSYNKAIKVMRYTRRFWYGVQCDLLVQCGTPYCRRYALSGKIRVMKEIKIIECEPSSSEVRKLELLLQSEWSDFSLNDYSVDLPFPLVVISDGEVVGGLAFTFFKHPSQDNEVVWVNALFVCPEYRGNGIAGKLVAMATKEAASNGLKEMFAHTDVPNLYQSRGWSEVDTEAAPDHMVMSVAL